MSDHAIQRLAPSAVLELLKPVTWFPPCWAFLCGVVSAGVPLYTHPGEIALGVLLCGPMVCATSQAINDWHDRHVDAINEPNRPIPSGRIPGKWGLYIAWIWAGLSMLVAMALGPVVMAATVLGLIFAWAYSAPPLRLKLSHTTASGEAVALELEAPANDQAALLAMFDRVEAFVARQV
jgi:chlorophyll synthase